jgi:hypothetical protein
MVKETTMIYVASPYTHLRDDVMDARFKMAEACTAFWMRQGLPAFSPIVHCRVIAINYGLPHDFVYWQRINFAWINACKSMWVLQLPNWAMSKGVNGEISHAEATLKDVSFFTWDEIKSISLTPLWNKDIQESIELLESV